MPLSRTLQRRSEPGPSGDGPLGASWSVALGCGLLAFAGAALVGWPLGSAAVRSVKWAYTSGGTAFPALADLARLLLHTMAAIGSIAALACVLALPAAWAISRGGTRGARVAAIVAVPLMLPNYLAYSGWGLVRGPRTMLGDWLASGSNVQVEWKTSAAGWLVAVWGLALWSWPLAAYVQAIYFRRITPDILDAATLDGTSGWRRAALMCRASRSGLLASAGLVMLVMLGSVVPLDVAQVETFSIRLLRLVSQRQHIEEAWIAGWPVYVVAAGAAAVMWRRLHAAPAILEESEPKGRALGRSVWVGVWMAWSLTVVVPACLFIYNMREPPDSVTLHRVLHLSGQFWRECRPAIRTSAMVGGMVAGMGVGLMLALWLMLSTFGRCRAQPARASMVVRTIASVTLVVFLTAGMLPGTLIGSAANRAWNMAGAPDWLGSSLLPVATTHLARFGFAALLLGWWLARQESEAGRDLRLIDGATGARGWMPTCLAAHWQSLLGATALLFVLSFHEIEATVQVQPPGQHALAQQLLDWLHMARDENLAAASVNLMGLFAALALVAGWMLFPLARTRNDSRT